MVKKYIITTINMKLFLERDLKLAYGGDVGGL